MGEWRKAISRDGDRLQSRLLVIVVGGVLALSALWFTASEILSYARLLSAYPADSHTTWSHAAYRILPPFGVSLTFGFLVWRLRAATHGGVLCGMLICYLLTFGLLPTQLWSSGLVPLITLFVITFIATKAGKQRKVELALAEQASGRNAAQVIANLGMAGLVVGTRWEGLVYPLVGPAPWINRPWSEPILWAATGMFLAAICEATADTVSSEIGQAFGGTPFMLTNFRRVPPGTDGAVSLVGTVAGVLGAALVALIAFWVFDREIYSIVTGFSGGIAGLLFDSFLGATVERRGWLGNDLVNFISTAFASLVALFLVLVFCQR